VNAVVLPAENSSGRQISAKRGVPHAPVLRVGGDRCPGAAKDFGFLAPRFCQSFLGLKFCQGRALTLPQTQQFFTALAAEVLFFLGVATNIHQESIGEFENG